MVGGKGERKNRKDLNASTLDSAEGGRSVISPQKSERDRAKEVCFFLKISKECTNLPYLIF